jgi:hypothetical protein
MLNEIRGLKFSATVKGGAFGWATKQIKEVRRVYAST